jgi:hypothetical protein
MTVKGFAVSCQDNDSYAFRPEPEGARRTRAYKLQQSVVPDMSANPYPGPRRCSKCGELLAKEKEPLYGLVIKRRRFDISTTYDGIDIASPAFKSIYESHGLTGLEFIPLPDDPHFFQIRAKRIVKFDAERVGTKFTNQCPLCGRYESVVVADPVILKPNSRIPAKGFVRTDLEFASEDEKFPLLLCGVTAGEILKAGKMKGLSITPIEN